MNYGKESLSIPVSTIPGSLCRISLATLLFLAFEGRYSVPLGLHLVYNRKALLSIAYSAQKREGGKATALPPPPKFTCRRGCACPG